MAQGVGEPRPLVALSGWRTPHISADLLRRRLRDRAGYADDRTLAVSFLWSSCVDAAAERLRKAIGERFGVGGDEGAPPVDVVALSMGGLVARRAAMDDPALPGRRLRIARLFTLGTPHLGAKLAQLGSIDRASRQMRPGSTWLAKLDEALVSADYELVCYARLNDWMVGATRTAPLGRDPHWKRGLPILAHHTLGMDTDILDDIGWRLSGKGNTSGRLTASRPPRD